MAVKCTECGAALQDDSKFCRYCGAKVVQEDLKRVEVKIDNTAEIKRAGYEEKESELRQKMMARELRMKNLKWKVTFGFNIVGIIIILLSLIIPDMGTAGVMTGIPFIIGPYLIMFMKWMG